MRGSQSEIVGGSALLGKLTLWEGSLRGGLADDWGCFGNERGFTIGDCGSLVKLEVVNG